MYSKGPTKIDQVFKKRPGTTDRGRDFEHLYMANIILKLIQDDSVEDFCLSSNDEQYGSFDDIVIQIKHLDKTQTKTYAIQLKQSKNQVLGSTKLTAATGNFSIPEYYHYYKKMKTLQNSVKLVLFTNCKANISGKIQLNIDDKEIDVDLTKSTVKDILSTSKQGFLYTFNPDENLEDIQNHFFNSFLLYTGQADVFQLARDTRQTFSTIFGSTETVFREYLNFINDWSLKEGKKLTLNKTWMKQLIATCVLSPFVKPLSFSTGSKVSDNTKTFRSAVSKFCITTLHQDSFEKIKSLWQDVVDDDDLDNIIEVNRIRIRYQVMADSINNKKELSGESKNISNLLWLLGKCPLVVEESPTVYKAIKLCQPTNIILLRSPQTPLPLDFVKGVFQTLADLRKEEILYETILNNFTYSLEGQKSASWKKLLQWNQRLEIFLTTDKIVEMINGPLPTGNHREILPPCHISRNLTTILIKTKYLRERDKGLIVITHVKNFDIFKEDFQMPGTIIINSFNSFDKKKDILYVSTNEVTREHFDKLCSIYGFQRKYHQFQYVNRKCLQWTRSNSDILDLRKFLLHKENNTNLINESLFFTNVNKTNIVCANPGMGKSTLMKSLKSNTTSELWTILLYARNHALYIRDKKRHVEEFKKYILDSFCKKNEDLDTEVYKILVENNQLQIIWDGLDEVSTECLVALLSIAEKISQTEIKQWITSRSNLKELLENTFKTFAKDITQFSDAEQQMYVQTRLNLSGTDLIDIFKKIKTNIEEFSNNDILGIPLQIYMLTELLSDNIKNVSLLNSSFTILDLYEGYVEKKFKIYFEDKTKYNLNIEEHYEFYKKKKTDAINFYKHKAVEVHLSNVKIKIVNSSKFLKKFKTKGDEIGLISKINDKNVAEFVHNSYGEYFAALYLFDKDPFKTIDDKFISNKKFNNIRFFLDLMLSKNCKAHKAVLYENSNLLNQCTREDLDCCDKIGRPVLELACTWGKVYTPDTIEDFNQLTYRTKEKLNYKEISARFNNIKDSLNLTEEKLMLLLPFLIKHYPTPDFIYSVLHYGFVLDYDIVVTYLKQTKWVLQTENLFNVAVTRKSRKCLIKFLTDSKFCQKLLNDFNSILKLCTTEFEDLFFYLQLDDLKLSALLTHDSEFDNLNHLEFLLGKGALPKFKSASGRLPIHYACQNGDFEATKLLIEKNSRLDISDATGRLPIHYSCESRNLETTRLLIEKNSKLDAPDVDGRLPIHLAAGNYFGFETVQLLVDNDARIDIPDKKGQLPIHYSCERGIYNTTKFLLDKKSKLDIPDATGRLPIHYASAEKNFKIIQLLIDRNSKLDVSDLKGRLPIHFASKHGNYETTKLLIEGNSKINTPDAKGRLPIHHACRNQHSGFEIVKLLIRNKSKLNVPDEFLQLPKDYAMKNPLSGPKILQLL